MTETVTNAQLVARGGRALYGDTWQSPLAELLGVNLRTLQRIARAAAEGEEYPSARALLDDLRQALRDRAGECDAIANDIDDLKL